MIAAASSKEDRTLETFRLVLVLAASNQELPESLKVYFRELIAQAKAIAEDPATQAKGARSDAILLALQISGDNQLRDRLQSLATSDRFPQDQAAAALNSMEAQFDPRHQFADFGDSVRATI